jgi:uncharacterized UBP type Zn finger protein
MAWLRQTGAATPAHVVNRATEIARPTPAHVVNRATEGACNGSSMPPTGIVNAGNTCWMNSVLQCILSVQELADSLEKVREPAGDADVAWRIAHEVALVAQAMRSDVVASYSRRDASRLKELLSAANPGLQLDDQNDADEGARTILNAIHEHQTAESGGNNTEVMRLFSYETQKKSTCDSCGDVRTDANTETTIGPMTLPMSGGRATSLGKLIGNALAATRPEGLRCEACKGVGTRSIETRMARRPIAALFSMGRFQYGARGMRKNGAAVRYPETHPSLGKLRAECMHSGSHFGGHYTANVRVCVRDVETWHAFSDESVKKKRLPGVKERTKEVYMLLYI